MGKFIIFLLIMLVVLYIVTGRYSVVRDNINERGFMALLDEPFWLGGLFSEAWQKLKENVNNFLDAKSRSFNVEKE